jgi:hypothetical protein
MNGISINFCYLYNTIQSTSSNEIVIENMDNNKVETSSKPINTQRILINKRDPLSPPTIPLNITPVGNINRKHHIDPHPSTLRHIIKRPSSIHLIDAMIIRVSIGNEADPTPTHQIRQLHELGVIVFCHVSERVGSVSFAVDVVEDENHFLEMGSSRCRLRRR